MSYLLSAVIPAKQRQVRVSPKEAVIMSILVNTGREMYGYEIMKHTKGEISLASIYTMLSRLEDKDLVSSRLETVPAKGYAIPRRWYRVVPGLTLKGEQDVASSKEGDGTRAPAVSGLAAA